MRYFEAAEGAIAANAWEDRHVEALAKDCVDLHILAALIHSLDSERVYGNRLSEYLVSGDIPRLMRLLDAIGTGMPLEFDTFWSVMPRGWIRRDQIEYNQLVDSDIQDIDVNGGIISPQFSRSAKVIARYRVSPSAAASFRDDHCYPR
jgi:hypothetical protein